MKYKRKKIGQQRHKPFPVVNVRFRPVGNDMTEECSISACQSLELFSQRQKALFMAQICGDPSIIFQGGFTDKERGELVWEKAYRDQLAGKEPEPIGYPVCAQCAAFVIAHFLNQEGEQKASMLIASAVTTGNDLILFDRNLSRDRTDPAVAVGTFETLADFREHYWQEIGE